MPASDDHWIMASGVPATPGATWWLANLTTRSSGVRPNTA